MPSEIPGGYVSCEGPDEAFLRNFVRSARKPPLTDPRVLHVTRCPGCLSRLMELRNETRAERSHALPFVILGGIFVVASVCAMGVFLYLHNHGLPAQIAAAPPPMVPVSQTIDLSTSRSTSVTPAQTQLTSIPRRTVELTLILPALSQSGPYSVAISKTKPAAQPAATGTGTAFEQGRQTRLNVTLNTGTVEPGAYYLSTTDKEGQVAYYYPLKVVP